MKTENPEKKKIEPNDRNAQSMWELMVELFPLYRSLLGPGFHISLKSIKKKLPLTIKEFPSQRRVFDWVIPKEFKVNSSYVVDPDGQKILDFEECHYHLFVYSQPFCGEMDREELLEHIGSHHLLPDAIPLRVTYYREKWGLCASQRQVDALVPGRYQVRIDTEHFDGALRMGEYFLPGESEEEVLITSYLCHPHGANDNLSGVAVAVELFKMLERLPRRRYSYRLVIWPETIGAVTYIYHYPERLKKTVGGYVLLCLGDDESGRFHYNPSFQKDSVFDRAVTHALASLGYDYVVLPGNERYSDERQFNGIGVRLPMGSLMRTPPGKYSTYHTSLDNLEYVKPEALFKSLCAYWKVLTTIERTQVYKGNFVVEPFLTGYGIYPFDLGVGEGTTKASGEEARKRARAYYHLMWNVDGKTDLLDIADKAGYPIEYFDRPVEDLLGANLMRPASKSRKKHR